jgi:hypothetical protein
MGPLSLFSRRDTGARCFRCGVCANLADVRVTAQRGPKLTKRQKAAPIEAALEEFFQLAHDPVRPLPRFALRRFDFQL